VVRPRLAGIACKCEKIGAPAREDAGAPPARKYFLTPYDNCRRMGLACSRLAG
jgi:hypothetical protein